MFWAGGRSVVYRAPAVGTGGRGESATFQAQAFGTQPITYQWYRNGAAVAGADGPLLSLDNLSPADSGGVVYCIAENTLAPTPVKPP
ncbi:MAG: immunoglobulin domain-containing protein [Lewinellaceae bacterium]|nr:immunoglobulin domain-containing protein [Lewinellaceae bacterium]